MEILVTERQRGKTTRIIEWMREAPEGEMRVCVSHSAYEAMRVYRLTFDDDDNPTDLASWQFIGVEEMGALRAGVYRLLARVGGQVVLGFDNLELTLPQMLGAEVGIITMSTDDARQTND